MQSQTGDRCFPQQYKLLFYTSKTIEFYEEPVPRANIILYRAVKFEAGYFNRISSSIFTSKFGPGKAILKSHSLKWAQIFYLSDQIVAILLGK